MPTRLALQGGLLTVLLLGCQPAGRLPSAGLQVLAAETFLADIAQNIAGDRLVIDSLVPAGADPHEFQLTPQDAIRLAQAQMIIVNGLGYEAWLEQTLDGGPPGLIVVEASLGITPAVQLDPHQWMDPLQVVRYAQNIRDALSQADPAGREQYASNAAAYTAELRLLDDWIKMQVSALPPERRVLVTNHDALRSFASAYGFEIAGVVVPGFSSGAAPSAQQMAALIETVRSLGVPAIFLDNSESPALANQIAIESGARVVTGLYVETLSAASGPAPTYIEMLKHDVTLIVEALK